MERHFAALQKNKKNNVTLQKRNQSDLFGVFEMLTGQHLKSLQNCYKQGWSYTASINSV